MRIMKAIPSSLDGWLDEIARAYLDASEAIPFGPLVGQELGPDELFHLGPELCLKSRGIKRSKKLVEKATTAALSSYLATRGQSEDSVSVPQMAFALSYLASHFGLDILDAETITEIMEHLEENQEKLFRLTGERDHVTEVKPTKRQGQFLAFIYYYTKLNGQPPAEHEMARHFGISPPSAHQMVVTLEKHGFISRIPGKSRSIRLLLGREQIPDLA